MIFHEKAGSEIKNELRENIVGFTLEPSCQIKLQYFGQTSKYLQHVAVIWHKRKDIAGHTIQKRK